MILPLGIPDDCVAIELMQTHKAYIDEQDHDKQVEMGERLYITLTNLGAVISCVCRDHRCSHWNGGRCRCGNTLTCREVRFLFHDWASRYDNITETDIRTFQFVLTPEDKKRQADESFIDSKVRMAKKVCDRAAYVRNYRDTGITHLTYESWGDRTSQTREEHFREKVASIRNTQGPMYAGAVGCLACSFIFQTEADVTAHVDRLRLLQDANHVAHGKVVTPTEIKDIRPTPPDYRGPEGQPQPSQENEHEPEHQPRSIDSYSREYDETDESYREHFSDYLRESYSDIRYALGCFECGKIYELLSDFRTHCRIAHNFITSADVTYAMVKPAEDLPEYNEDTAHHDTETEGPQ